jgi:hypothetical protein
VKQKTTNISSTPSVKVESMLLSHSASSSRLQPRLCVAISSLITRSLSSFRHSPECTDALLSPFSFSILHQTCFCYFPFLFCPYCILFTTLYVSFPPPFSKYEYHHLGYDTVQSGRSSPTFRRIYFCLQGKRAHNLAIIRKQVHTKPINMPVVFNSFLFAYPPDVIYFQLCTPKAVGV